MGITNNGLNIIAANMTGSALVVAAAVGSGGTAFNINQSGLQYERLRSFLDTTDLIAAGEITFNTTFSPVEVSGLIFREFGHFTVGSVMLNREVINGSFVFDGEEELNIQQTIKFFV